MDEDEDEDDDDDDDDDEDDEDDDDDDGIQSDSNPAMKIGESIRMKAVLEQILYILIFSGGPVSEIIWDCKTWGC